MSQHDITSRDITILHGDAITRSSDVGDRSVQTIVTSPPYWKQRDYGHDGQIGQEDTPEGFVESLVSVFRAYRDKLRDDGTLWVNLGDKYGTASTRLDRLRGYEKSKLMIPHRFAIAMLDSGWKVRAEIIWAKKSPMPGGQSDRPTTSHEQIFLLSKQDRYFYDKYADHPGRNLLTVWDDLSTSNYHGEHFAPYPVGLPLRCIKLSTSAVGACPHCGAGWVRHLVKERVPTRPARESKTTSVGGDTAVTGNRDPRRHVTRHKTLGWIPQCKCDHERADVVPSVVLDPFHGTGTTSIAAEQLGRRAIGVELNEKYVAQSVERIESERVRLSEGPKSAVVDAEGQLNFLP